MSLEFSCMITARRTHLSYSCLPSEACCCLPYAALHGDRQKCTFVGARTTSGGHRHKLIGSQPYEKKSIYFLTNTHLCINPHQVHKI